MTKEDMREYQRKYWQKKRAEREKKNYIRDDALKLARKRIERSKERG